MDFREHQDKARRKTFQLVSIYFLMILLASLFLGSIGFVVESSSDWKGQEISLFEHIIQKEDFLIDLMTATAFALAIVAPLVIFGSMFGFFRRSNGHDVARAFGGHELTDNNAESMEEKQLLNIVQEMAIAASVAPPPVYIIEDSSINAFAAGKRAEDSVIGITRGAIDNFNREEMAGVVAHEMGHIVNQDIKLDMRLSALLFGFGLIIYLAKMAWYYNMTSRGDARQKLFFFGVALSLFITGFLLALFGKILKFAVSRQREFLADASAVQLTRNPEGLISAFHKIQNPSAKTEIDSPMSSEYSHAFIFGRKSFNLFSTHPPMSERIKRLNRNTQP